jgi:hypothetical protein
MRPRVEELPCNSSPAEGPKTLCTPAGVSSLIRDETREESKTLRVRAGARGAIIFHETIFSRAFLKNLGVNCNFFTTTRTRAFFNPAG